jgi:Dullard-like phosphatase family protein
MANVNPLTLNGLVTQVRNPNEPEDEDDPFGVNKIDVNSISTVTGPNKPPLSPRTQSGYCAFFCCGARDDEKSSGTKPDRKKKTLKKPKLNKIQIQTRPGGDYGVNSPRGGISNEDNTKATAPWADDHLLPPQKENKGKKCLVLDLDETLVHSSFKPVESDFTVEVEIENQVYKVFVAKRPHVDQFMKRCGELFEVVVFTASLAKYADPVLDLLDQHKVVDWRLFRESCSPFKGSYVKDLGRMGRDINSIMILDNSPHSYFFNPENAIPCESWFSDLTDHELLDLIPILEQLADPQVTDVRAKLKELGISGEEAIHREMGAVEPEDEEESYDGSYEGSLDQNQDDENNS